ncbi:Lrp/AsnC family transcriptional regulator [Thermococcus sp. M39]|uniref:Lrp/AsnC family transcriptional regulator n=1 Tax=unclassified Thermococcus TaxID=2627626 RepID=UPI00143CAA29|nr:MULTISPECIES: Lrp/AsnC family transcriptional regulator [unclassified Thermococcus]NJE08297.1 Lrp/AsnC family transcriptional regulator [Thermococcus sp. M39]NJE11790.1 Lrp/AsnC family transcriptional regulator [Thermococcus sp. LS2]
MVGIDEKDEEILRELRKNGRATLTELGRKVGLSPASIKNRIEKLEKLGAIKGYSAIVDPTFLNEFVQAIIEVELLVDNEAVDRMLYNISQLDNVVGVYRKTGEFQILIMANFRDVSQLKEFVKSLSSEYLGKNMRRSRVSVIIDAFKESGVVLYKERKSRRRR